MYSTFLWSLQWGAIAVEDCKSGENFKGFNFIRDQASYHYSMYLCYLSSFLLSAKVPLLTFKF